MPGHAYGVSAYGGDASYYGKDTPVMTPDHTIRIGRSRADAVTVPMPEYTVGEETTFDLVFDSRSRIPHQIERYDQLRDRGMYANSESVITDTAFDGTPWFAESHPYETLLVDVEPGRDLAHVRGVWGILTGVEDDSEIPEQHARVSVTVFVLADRDEYETRYAVRREFER